MPENIDRQTLQLTLNRYNSHFGGCPYEDGTSTGDTDAALIRIVLDLQQKVQDLEAKIAQLRNPAYAQAGFRKGIAANEPAVDPVSITGRIEAGLSAPPSCPPAPVVRIEPGSGGATSIPSGSCSLL